MIWFKTYMSRLFSVVFALAFMQIPNLINQYIIYLSGRVDELSLQANNIRLLATNSGMDVHSYIQKFMDHGDADFSAQGENMAAMLERFTQISNSLESLRNASLWTRWFEMLRSYNQEMFQGMWKNFNPGISITLESSIYACVGVVVATLLTHILSGLFARKKEDFTS